MESPCKRFAMFTTDEQDANIVIDHFEYDEITVARSSNDIPQRDDDGASYKSHTLSPPPMKKVWLLFVALKPDSDRGCAVPELGTALSGLTTRFTEKFISHFFLYIQYTFLFMLPIDYTIAPVINIHSHIFNTTYTQHCYVTMFPQLLRDHDDMCAIRETSPAAVGDTRNDLATMMSALC